MFMIINGKYSIVVNLFVSLILVSEKNYLTDSCCYKLVMLVSITVRCCS